MITIILASSLLTVILMFAVGQNEKTKRDLSHAQEVGYYNLTEEQVEKLKNDERIAYQVQVKTGTVSEMDGFSIIPYYVSQLSDKIRIAELESGKLPQAENEIAVQKSMLEKLNVSPKVGSKVTLEFYDGNTETFVVSGIIKGEGTNQFAVFFSKDYADNGSQLKDSPYEVYAKIYGASTMNEYDCKECMYLIGSDAGIERKYVSPSKAFLDTLSINSQQVLTYGVVGAVILLACILVIYGVFYLSVIGRIHQFGQLRTIGMTKKQMKKFVSKEGRLLFLKSAPIGILIGIIVGYFILPEGFSIVNTLIIVACVFVVIYLITMTSITKPSKIASDVSPIEAIRYTPQDTMKNKANKKTCRNLSPIGLGIMNFSKNKKKATITMLSLGLGGILFITAATYMSSFDKADYSRQGYFKDAEFYIQYSESAIELEENGTSGIQAKSPMNDNFVKEIENIEGVEKVTEVKNFGISYDFPEHSEYDNDDYILPLNEEQIKNIDKYIEDGTADYDKLMTGNYILVADNGNVEEIYGWKFNIGDKITIHYFDGNKMAEREVEILGTLSHDFVLDNSSSLEGWFVMPEKPILNWLTYDSLNAQILISTDESKTEQVGAELEQIVEERPELSLETLAESTEIHNAEADRVFGAISGLAIFIMMFSILSMMNTLITNIVTRKQELAMLESIGMSKSQIRKMLLGESLLLVIATVGVTLTIGTLCGYFLCNMLYNNGMYYMSFKFPTVFTVAYVVVLTLVPLVITIASMKSFSKEALVERLRGMDN
jgi:putative ABC transport system permease protein